MDELRLECVTRKPDIVIVTESWLSAKHEDDCFLMNDYFLFRQDRINKIGGGTLVWIRHTIPALRINPAQAIQVGEFVFLSFKFFTRLYILCASYLPPNRTAFEDECVNDFIISVLDSFCDNHPNCHVLICGDFNRFDTSILMSSFDPKFNPIIWFPKLLIQLEAMRSWIKSWLATLLLSTTNTLKLVLHLFLVDVDHTVRFYSTQLKANTQKMLLFCF